PISVRSALQKITSRDWVLPVTQRPYVWGDRYRFEKAIYRLFDSLYRNYPIGTFLLWDTAEAVPFREFLQVFDPDASPARPVERGAWSRQKNLVYDGQQRLQSIFSCLLYAFCGRVLCFDLFFDPATEATDATGFLFAEANADIPSQLLRLNALYEDYRRSGRDGITDFRRRIAKTLEYVGD